MKFVVSLAAGCFAVACAIAPRPVVVPHHEPVPHLGINLGPERMTPLYLDVLAAVHRPLTLRVPVHSVDEARATLRALDPYPDLSALLLVEHADLDLVTSLAVLIGEPQLAGLELGNELDLAGLTSTEFATFVSVAVLRLQRAHWTADLLSGGIYTVDTASLAYAAPMLASLGCDVTFGVHLYGDTSDDVLADLQTAAGCHPIAITEAGCPSITPQEDVTCAADAAQHYTAAVRVGANYWLAYQLVSGPTRSNLDNFGWLRFDGTPKPIWTIFQ